MKLVYTYDIFSAQRYWEISRYCFELINRVSLDAADVKVLAGLYINEYIKALPGVKGLRFPPSKSHGVYKAENKRGISGSHTTKKRGRDHCSPDLLFPTIYEMQR